MEEFKEMEFRSITNPKYEAMERAEKKFKAGKKRRKKRYTSSSPNKFLKRKKG